VATLYLDNTATASPFPTTSKKLVTSAPAAEVQLGPGEFDSGLPGNTDAGQWNPSSAIGDTTAAAEIDNTGASLGTTRQGWLYDVDLTGQTLPSGTWAVQLRLRANQGTGTLGRVLMRVTVVTGSSGAWTTVANLLTTSITGASSNSTGQSGWRANEGSRLTVTSTAANFSTTIATTSTAHTFTSGQRLLVELGFGDADSTTDRTWRLDYNTSNTFVTAPDLYIGGTLASVAPAQTEAITGAVTVGGAAASSQAAQTESATVGVVVGVTAASSGAAQTSSVTAGAIVGAAIASAAAAQTSFAEGTVEDAGTDVEIAGVAPAQTSALTGGVRIGGTVASAAAAQTEAIAAGVQVSCAIAGQAGAQTSAATGGLVVGVTAASQSPAQTESVTGTVRVSGTVASAAAPQISQLSSALPTIEGEIASSNSAQTSNVTGGPVVGTAAASQASAQTSGVTAVVVVGVTASTEQPAHASSLSAAVAIAGTIGSESAAQGSVIAAEAEASTPNPPVQSRTAGDDAASRTARSAHESRRSRFATAPANTSNRRAIR
jgi:hypothetical protein